MLRLCGSATCNPETNVGRDFPSLPRPEVRMVFSGDFQDCVILSQLSILNDTHQVFFIEIAASQGSAACATGMRPWARGLRG